MYQYCIHSSSNQFYQLLSETHWLIYIWRHNWRLWHKNKTSICWKWYQSYDKWLVYATISAYIDYGAVVVVIEYAILFYNVFFICGLLSLLLRHANNFVFINIYCLLCSVFSKRWLVYAAGTNTDVCARNYLYPVFLLTKTQPRGFYQWIFIKDTPLPDWQDDQTQELGHAVYWVHL